MPRPMIPVKVGLFSKEFIISVVRKGGDGRNCLFGDLMGYSANDLMKAGRFNCTVVESNTYESFGQLNVTSGKYNGMNGIVQAGQADFGLATQMIPMETDDFKYGPVLSNSRVTILSSYAKYDPSLDETIDVTEVFSQIDPSVFVTYAAFLFIFMWLLALGKRLLGSTDRTNSLWTVATFASDQGSFSDESKKFYLLLISCLTLFVFWCLQYFGNFMTTELVRPKVPKTIDSFEDILHYHQLSESRDFVDDRSPGYTSLASNDASRPRPLFMKGVRSLKFFEHAAKGSVTRRVFEQAVRMNGGRDKAQVNVADSFSAGFAINAGSVILVEAETILRLVRVTMCNVMTSESAKSVEFRSLLFARNASIPYMLGYVYSPNIAPNVRERLDTVLYGFAESGLSHKLVYEVSTAIASITHKIEMCLSDEVAVTVPDFLPLQVKHLVVIFKALAVALFAALLAFIGEIIYKRWETSHAERISETLIAEKPAEMRRALSGRATIKSRRLIPGERTRVYSG